ncbi:OmpH family outer membrane protein [Flavobacterium sp.]|uniref:OmpH family outer membrane protein n=1 Tax=Flavobacterium sp. TaxID=239 RepID=UPI0039E37BCB
MKKSIVLIALAVSIISCNQKAADVKEIKTAYVDTSKLMEEYTEAKDLEAKYKAKSEEMGRELEAEINKFKAEASNFQRNAQANGQAWAQQKGAELSKREQQLSYAQEAMLRQLRQEQGVEADSMVSKVKKFIKDYGKKNGYAYVFGTGEAVSILYAEEKYDITKDVTKLLNDQYKSEGKKEEGDVKAEAKKELEAIEKKK